MPFAGPAIRVNKDSSKVFGDTIEVLFGDVESFVLVTGFEDAEDAFFIEMALQNYLGSGWCVLFQKIGAGGSVKERDAQYSNHCVVVHLYLSLPSLVKEGRMIPNPCCTTAHLAGAMLTHRWEEYYENWQSSIKQLLSSATMTAPANPREWITVPIRARIGMLQVEAWRRGVSLDVYINQVRPLLKLRNLELQRLSEIAFIPLK